MSFEDADAILDSVLESWWEGNQHRADYYAAFHHAKSYVEVRTSIELPRDGAAHGRIPDELRRMRPAQTKTANKLVELKRLRTWADYRAGCKMNLPAEVDKAFAHAKFVIDHLK